MKADGLRLAFAVGLALVVCGVGLTAFGVQYLSRRPYPTEVCGLGDGCLPTIGYYPADPAYFYGGISLVILGALISTFSNVKVTTSWRQA